MTTQDLLDDRYGRRRSPARRWLVALGALVVVGAVGYDALRGRIESMRQCGATFC